MRPVVILVAVAMVLAGCVSGGPEVEPDSMPVTIQGVVVDHVLAPLEGATVTLMNKSQTHITDANGSFRFSMDEGLGTLELKATMDGFKDASMVLTNGTKDDWGSLRVQMEPMPSQEPYVQRLPFNGFIACSALVAVGHNHGGNAHEDDDVDCGADASSEDMWEFEVDSDLENAVIEVAWDADLTAAEYLSMTIEGVGVDDGDDRRFFFTEGTSPLRGTLSRLQSNVFFAEDGGTVRVSVQVAGPESDVVASAAVNQEFKVIASLFYVEPGPRDYSIVSG